MAEIRENLSEKINSVEKEAALGRAAMTLDRERAMSAVEKNRLDMAADAAAARASIRMETVKAVAELDRRIAIIENRVK
jgi:hypothetical protein